ncbi:MAG: AAA family ATPase [Myxococcales bacterium]|nr:AAA family ATPase [Myxococcales bacterium]
MQLELALLCREHVLIIGPPGTAKSAIAGAVLGRIADEKTGRPSLFSKQLAENTVQTDLIGPVDFKVLTETGRTEHLTEEGMLGAVHAFLDEVFDGRDMLLRSILNVLHERELKHGRKVTPGRCECAVMTSNRYLSEVLQRSPETLQAFADRISFICFTPKSFARKASRAQMLWRSQTGQRPALHERLTLQQLDVLQDTVAQVEVPAVVSEGLELLADTLERELLAQVVKLPDYVPTKYFSQRSMVKALWALRAVVVRDRIYRRPDRRLVADIDDLRELKHFFLLGGPPPEELEGLLKTAVDPRERAQLEILRVEHKAFADAIERVLPQLGQAVEREAADLQVKDDLASAEAMARSWSAAVASATAAALKGKLVPGPRHPDNRAPLLCAAEALLGGLELRVARGMSAQGEGRGGIALLGSFADVLDLARRVPELQDRLPAVSRQVAEYCRQAAQMIALAAEASEFDETIRLEGIAGLATNLSEELSRLVEVLQNAALVTPELEEQLRGELTEVRERAASALRRRTVRAFAQPTAKKAMEPLEQLTADSRRLRELERSLIELSARHTGLRAELLTPLGEAYAKEALARAPFARLDELTRAVQVVAGNLIREGASAEAGLRAVRELIERRVDEHVKTALVPPRTPPPEAQPAFSGEAYTVYRQQLAAAAPDGELLALSNLTGLFTAVSLPALSADLRDAVATAEVTSLVARVRFLRGWLTQLFNSLPQPEALRNRADADRAFDQLVKSRLPMLVTREGEWVRLKAAAGRLNGEAGERGQAAQKVESMVETMAEEFMSYARRLLDARAAK